MRLRSGSLVSGRYEVRGLLGRGGMGEVYRALDRELDREVALKVLPGLLQQRDSFAVERFLRQARLAVRVHHPAVVQVFDCGLDGDLPYVVQERLTGRTVADLLAHERRLDEAAAIDLLRELCQALIATHEAGVVHRDVKPDNLFLHSTGKERPCLKLLDFGLARLLRSPEALTRTQEGFGTLSYMAPEQLREARGARIEADVYALGSVLFELLTGRPPFVRNTRAELKLALLHDPAPDPREFVPGLAAWLCELCLRALAKRPELRFRNVSTLLAAIDEHGEASRAAPRTALPYLSESDGFRVERLLGRGAHGDVHAAFDLERGQAVALKSASCLDVEAVHRLKREFRTLRGLQHRNVVRVYSLFERSARVWLALALVEGTRFDEYVRVSRDRLHTSLVQLAEALCAVHARGVAHRDLKPANVLVDDTGRVLLLDFGLAMAEGAEQGGVEGSAKYLPPEAQRGRRGCAADLYALGVMIEDALAAVPGPVDRAESAPDTLVVLAAQLCDREPTRRPSAAQVLAALRGAEADVRATLVEPPFVGRASELTSLRAAFQASARGRAYVVDIAADDGMGKSALLERFLGGLPEKTLILRGACRHDEQLPLGPLDSAIDALAEHLCGLPPAAQRVLVPREVSRLVESFPALLRVECIRERAGARRQPDPDADLRAVAVSELRVLLANVAAERPIVLALEDMHWVDGAAVDLLSRILEEPGPPNLLLLSTRRLRRDVAPLCALFGRSATVSLPLAALTPEESLTYLRASTASAKELLSLSASTHGHPYLLAMWSRADRQRTPPACERTLEQAFEQLLQPLGPGARRLLAAICLSVSPLPVALLLSSVDAGPDDLSELELAGLVMRDRADAGWFMGARHEVVRRVVLASLDEASCLDLHTRLLSRLSESEQPVSLVRHLALAGRSAEAVELALRLAGEAEAKCGFAQATTLYQLATEYASDDDPRRAELHERCARVLHLSGRSREAARAMQSCLALCSDDESRVLEPKVSELLLLSGEVSEGLQLMQKALERRGLSLASDLLSVMQATLSAYLELKGRGMVLGAATSGSADARERTELFTSIAMTLSHVDLRGLPFSFHAASSALELGDEALALKACAVFVWSTVSQFPNDLVEAALALCGTLAERVATPYGRALLLIAQSEYHHFAGRFLAAEAESERAEQLLVSECTGVTREISGVRSLQAFMQYAHKGDFSSRLEETTRWQAEAEASDNRYQVNMLRSAHALVWVAKDRPELARTQLAAAERDWPEGVSAFEVTVALFLDVIDRYEGDATSPLRVAQGRAHILSSPIAQVPMFKGYLDFQRAWGALSALSRGEHEHDEAKQLRRAIEALYALNMPLWRAFADACAANQQLLLRSELASSLALLEQSEQTFRELHTLCLAACARRRRGELTHGPVGERIRHEAERELRKLGVVRVDRWCRAYFSPFEVDKSGSQLTRTD